MLDSGNVTLLERDGRKWYLIGTAHVSKDSVIEVGEVIHAVKPDTVCVELCETRYNALKDVDRWKKLDIFKVIKEGKTLMLLANLAIGAYQRRLGEELGVEPGAELMAGAEKADEVGAKLELVDRDIQVTLKRTWANLSFWQKIKLMGAIFGSLFETEDIGADEIEKLKENSELSDMMEEFARVMPEVQKPLIDERDQYLMSSIEEAPGDTVVAIVGAGHVPGMKRYFGQTIDRETISVVPPPSRWVKALKWVIPVLILAAFSWGLTGNPDRTMEEILLAWLLPNSIVAAVLTAAAGGKLLSILTAFVGSPITSLNPLVGAGMVVGLVEAWQRKPTVEDCENINQDVQSIKGIYKNPFTRVLLVAVAANIGSSLGAWIGISWVMSLLA
ncbi:MAG: TraB/GumN family protein [Deltaproteobacteria bacterium]|jgi:pheromone shutdown-related protein TraB|nr:TraB/GumN family protein [Deltaproteobacteria bacterium]MBT6433356.1 TraB/GumN family protein [Deltaproteobacteria bacterium]MBT6490780.1 TraB/GumN family protein [Deltaproteobacteria bacterium]